MVKAVFTTKVSPVYDDLPECRYHFPRTYLKQVQAAIGDWIVYYEPRRSTGHLSSSGGRQSYFATARLDSITGDPSRADHFYAHVSHYLGFARAVPFVEGEHYYEGALRKDDRTTNKGAFGRAVRHLRDGEYDQICDAGFAHVFGPKRGENPAPDETQGPDRASFGFAESEKVAYIADEPAFQSRQIVEQLISRPFRDRAFASAVKSAYNDTCAITGFRIINGGGRSEVQAAHIRPVAADGPDSVRNGVALSGTVHWMFDRGLLSVDDDYRLLIARDRVPAAVNRLLLERGRLSLPHRAELWPHSQFLSFHREQIFKG